MALTGDFSKLDALLARMRRVRPEEAAAQAAAPVLQDLVQAQAQAGRDPDGTSWPPRADGSLRTLGSIPASLSARVERDGRVVVESSNEHAVFHAQHLVPGELPAAWRGKVADAVAAELKKKIGG